MRQGRPNSDNHAWVMGFLHKIKRGGAETQIAIGVVMVFLVGILAIGASAAGYPTDFGDPAISTTESGSGVTCAAWINAPDGYQDDITKAANKVGIQPALLGAIFLSEHADGWATPGSDGVWAQGGSAKGPFQIESWDNYWKQVVAEGYNEGRSASEASVENIYDAGIASAVSLMVGFKSVDVPKDASEQKHVYYAGLYHNNGPCFAKTWADKGFDITQALTSSEYAKCETNDVKFAGREWGTHDYAKRTWQSFNNLNKGCDVLNLVNLGDYSGVRDILVANVKFVSSTSFPKLMPSAAVAFEQLAKDYEEATKQKLPVSSMFRTYEVQGCMHEYNGKTGIGTFDGPASPYGSWHEAGLAFDANLATVGQANYATLKSLGEKNGWKVINPTWGASEDHHFDYIPGKSSFSGVKAAILAATGKSEPASFNLSLEQCLTVMDDMRTTIASVKASL